MSEIFSIGHSILQLDKFILILKEIKITIVADIRSVPRSRHNPQFNKDTLPAALSASSTGYLHFPGLGGLRKTLPDSPNGAWRNSSFRGFADYMQTAEFEDNLNRLIALSQTEQITLMCAEAVPWRCHRSLIADALTVRGIKVEHILSIKSTRLHVLTPFAKIQGNTITYPPLL